MRLTTRTGLPGDSDLTVNTASGQRLGPPPEMKWSIGGMGMSFVRSISVSLAIILFNVCGVRGFTAFPVDSSLHYSSQLRLIPSAGNQIRRLTYSRKMIGIDILSKPMRSRRIPAVYALTSLVETASFNVLLSKILGYCIVAGSFFLQLPQLLKIMKNRSVLGLSSLSRYSEVPISSSTVIYHYLKNLPFSSYGEVLSFLTSIDSPSICLPSD